MRHVRPTEFGKPVRGGLLKDIERRYRDGDVIFREGEKSATAFVIVSGQVELFKTGPNGPIRLCILSPGEIFGEMGIIDKSARSATAQAVGTVVLDVIERDGFLASLSEQPEVALTVIGNLAERLRHTNELIYNPQNSNSSSTALTVQPTANLGPDAAPDVQRRRATIFQKLSRRAVSSSWAKAARYIGESYSRSNIDDFSLR